MKSNTNISHSKKKHILIFIFCCFVSPLFIVGQFRVNKQAHNIISSNFNIDNEINHFFNFKPTTSLLTIGSPSHSNNNQNSYNSHNHNTLITIVISSILLNVICVIILFYNFRKNKYLRIENQEQIKEISYLKLFKINKDESVITTSDKEVSKFGILDKLMKVDKFYLDPSCNRESLIKELGIDKNSLSELLKKHKYDNLPDYINRFRLEESIRLLNNEDQLSIDQIAKQSGFGTSRSLQRQFKERYNISPSEYRKIINKNKNIVSNTEI